MGTDAVVRDIALINEHARAIGYVCILWAAMEARIDQFIEHLIPIAPGAVSDIVTANASLHEKLEMLKALAFARKRDADWSYAVEQLTNVIDGDLRPERNRLIHDSWHNAANDIIRRTRKTKIKKPAANQRELIIFTDTPMKVEAIWDFAAAIREAERTATILRLNYGPRPSP